ncbi:uncharacterized protein TNCV_4040351 [Trichonephila clavipes]|nr:uncharacterized protein TNCV_4040351 [Trichonephila clavipes]
MPILTQDAQTLAITEKDKVTLAILQRKQIGEAYLRKREEEKTRSVEQQHVDFAPRQRLGAHWALTETVLEDKRIIVIGPPPYSPDFEPCDFYLFLKVNNALIGTHFQSVREVKPKTAHLMKMVTPNKPQHCFERWKIRMQLCIDKEEEYVEED